MSWLRKLPFKLALLVLAQVAPVTLFASNYGITYQGRILNREGQPLVSSSVQFLLGISAISAADQSECLLYSEMTSLDMSEGSGGFAVVIGQGNRTDPSTIPLEKIFNPELNYPIMAQCPKGFTKKAHDKLYLTVSFNAGQGFENLSPLEITYSPYSIDTVKVAGIDSGRVLRVDDDPDAKPLATDKFALNVDNFKDLLDLINGTSSKYVRTDNRLELPTSPGMVNQVLTSDGNGGTLWDNPFITSITAGAGLTTVPGSTGGEITDAGTLTLTTTGVVAGSYGSTSNSGTTIATFSVDAQGRLTAAASTPIPTANAGTTGLLSSADWNTFNNKMGTSSIFSGDISGMAAAISVDKIKGTSVSETAPTSAQFLVYDGSTQYAPVSLGGDASMTNSGTVTIAASAVTNSKMANMPAVTIKANTTGVAAAPADVTIASLQGTTASTFAAGNDTRINNALQKTGDSMSGMLTLATGTTALSPVRIPPGTLVTTAVSGNLESNGANLFWTTSTPARQKLAMYPEVSTPANGQLLIGNGSGFSVANLIAGAGVTITNSAGGISISAAGSGGTVSNVTSANSDISVATQTSTPVLTLNSGITGGATDANKIAKLNASGQLTSAMIPDLDIARITTGVLPIARGGTNSGTALSNNRVMASSGGAIVEAAAITASRAIVSNTNGIPTHSEVTSMELGYLSGVTSAIQTQLNGKASSGGYTNYSVIGVNGAGALTAYSGSKANTTLQYSVSGPVWSNATYPSTIPANQLLYSSLNDTVVGLASTANAVLTTNASGVPNWAALSSDGFAQYALLAGRSGGQTLHGGNVASNSLTLDSTSNAAKGNILLNPLGGNVGIGTTNPTSALQVVGNVRVGEINPINTGTLPGYGRFLYFSGGPAGGVFNSDNSDPLWLARYNAGPDSSELRMNLGDGAASADAFVVGTADFTNYLLKVQADGKVGVGTTNPGYPLDVMGVGRFVSPNNGTTGGVIIKDATGNPGKAILQFVDNAGTSQYSYIQGLAGTGMALMGGNVGIGATNPLAQLQIGQSAMTGAPATAMESRRLSFGTHTHTGAAFDIYSRDLPDHAYLDFRYSTSVPIMTLKGNGLVGIGTTAPERALHISRGRMFVDAFAADTNGQTNAEILGRTAGGTQAAPSATASDTTMLFVGARGYGATNYVSGASAGIGFMAAENYTDSTAASYMVFYTRASGPVLRSERMRITKEGYVGIGLTAPTYQLQLSTDSAAKPGTSTWVIASDARLKDIRAPFDRGLEALQGINPIYFRYKENNSLGLPSEKEYVGIIAQDAQKAVPEAVDADKQGYLHVSNDAIIWTILNSVKELYHKVMQRFESQDISIASKADRADFVQLKAENAAKDKLIAELRDKAAKAEKESVEIKARLDRLEKALNSR